MTPAAAHTGVCLTEVQRLDALRELEQEWARLFEEARGVTPFLHPAWLLSWCEAFGIERVCAAIVRDSPKGRLLAVLPCHDPEGDPRGLALLGGDLSDHRGPVMRAGEEEAAGTALFAWTESRHSRAVFDDLPGDHPWASAPLREGWARALACVCPVVSLRDSVEQWTERLPHGLRRNLRRYGARLEQLGCWERRVADEGNVADVIEAFITLHGARWHAHGEAGVLDTAAVQRFHRISAPRLQRAGLLRLHAWALDGRIVAVQHVLVNGIRACAYLAGYDPAFAPLSIGTVLIAAAVEHAIREGCREFDFLRGVEPYKYAWGAANQNTWRVSWSREGTGD
jgi:CelD/BcsL family acetyltransferase involved in cellulose biosynthesis